MLRIRNFRDSFLDLKPYAAEAAMIEWVMIVGKINFLSVVFSGLHNENSIKQVIVKPLILPTSYIPLILFKLHLVDD